MTAPKHPIQNNNATNHNNANRITKVEQDEEEVVTDSEAEEDKVAGALGQARQNRGIVALWDMHLVKLTIRVHIHHATEPGGIPAWAHSPPYAVIEITLFIGVDLTIRNVCNGVVRKLKLGAENTATPRPISHVANSGMLVCRRAAPLALALSTDSGPQSLQAWHRGGARINTAPPSLSPPLCCCLQTPKHPPEHQEKLFQLNKTSEAEAPQGGIGSTLSEATPVPSVSRHRACRISLTEAAPSPTEATDPQAWKLRSLTLIHAIALQTAYGRRLPSSVASHGSPLIASQQQHSRPQNSSRDTSPAQVSPQSRNSPYASCRHLTARGFTHVITLKKSRLQHAYLSAITLHWPPLAARLLNGDYPQPAPLTFC
ncbi:hypothetical protein DFH27DRAFT_656733 [Peziza echinospora]|nr:hypothetical protein DFH27DRAFT_656733 [Peziza echinospora]